MTPPAEPPYDPVLHVVLHQPEIPPNTGNIGRTCVAVGAKLWLVRPLGFELSEKQLRRAGLDYWPHLNWEVVDDWATLEQRLAANRRWLFTKTAVREYTEVSYFRGDVLVFGSETAGSAAAVAVYEAMRQIGASQLND